VHSVTDRQTDRQTTYDGKTALCTKVHRAVKKEMKCVCFTSPTFLVPESFFAICD